MKKNEEKEFDLVSLPPECNDPSITKDDFKLVQTDAKIHDQKFETKPTTFLKDCLKRFRKNKSSVVAAFILGILLVMSVVVPVFFKTSDIHDTKTSHPEIYYLEPKLFNAGTGFWDGTKKMEDIAVDTTSENKEDWGPDYKRYNKNAISNLVIGEEQYIKSPNKYAHDGYIQFGYFGIPNEIDHISYSTQLVTKEIASEEVVPEIPENTFAVENIIEHGIIAVNTPDKIEQYDELNRKTISAEIKYKDVNDGDIIKDAVVPVDEITLDTSEVANGVTGTVRVGTETKEFTIDVIVKQGTKFKFNEKLEVTNFVTYDTERLANSDEMTKTYPEGYIDADSALFLVFEQGTNAHEVQLTDYKKAHDIGGTEEKVDIQALFKDYCDNHKDEDDNPDPLEYDVTNIQIEVRVRNAKDGRNACTLIKSIGLEFSSSNYNAKKIIEAYSFKDGNQVYIRTKDDGGVWTNISNSLYSKETNYLVKGVLCSFTYDTYEAVLGRVDKVIFITELQSYKNKGYLEYKIDTIKNGYDEWVVDELTFKCKIKNETKCPLVEPFKAEDVIIDQSTGLPDRVECAVYRYKMDPYNLDQMPRFLLGTDKSGRDMFIYVFEGLRTSLLLGIVTSAICFLFGLLWGSISGYFGGAVDLAMERFTDILSGVPWIVVMTLTIIHLGSTFFTFALALCLTGWIGTSHITRTQFYRFRGREYVLASRTLGASHGRLIAKHILPNAIGTIITSAVLMVPSIIFSEATISYLGLGFKNLASLGVILSDNQVELTNHPYLLIFPAIIIALLMISFNLFGNGLRDAVNPSLKGEGE